MSSGNGDKLSKLMNKFEQVLIRFIVLNLIVIVVFQLLLTQGNLRTVLSKTEVVETMGSQNDKAQPIGEVLEYDQISAEYLTLNLEYDLPLPKLLVLVNGMQIEKFSNRQVTIKVKNNDLLEIDGTFYPYVIGIKIDSASTFITNPKIGDKIFVNNSIESFGRIKIQDRNLEKESPVGYNGN